MKALVQRVSRASVAIAKLETRKISQGIVILLGVTQTDTGADADYLADKVLGLRIFRDELGKMNLSVRDIGGDCLVISQFTLYGDARKGRRPSFVAAAPAAIAEPLYERFLGTLRETGGITVLSGEFGADMSVEIINDGPVTLMLESECPIQHGI
jgi:D-tyrosyl-tRNA(Tyr) deacylase